MVVAHQAPLSVEFFRLELLEWVAILRLKVTDCSQSDLGLSNHRFKRRNTTWINASFLYVTQVSEFDS